MIRVRSKYIDCIINFYSKYIIHAYNYRFLNFFKWWVNWLSESTWRMHEATWRMQMIRSGDNCKTQRLSHIDRFFFSVVCVPPPLEQYPHTPIILCTYFGAYLKNYSHDFPEALGSCSKLFLELICINTKTWLLAISRWAIPIIQSVVPYHRDRHHNMYQYLLEKNINYVNIRL